LVVPAPSVKDFSVTVRGTPQSRGRDDDKLPRTMMACHVGGRRNAEILCATPHREYFSALPRG
jgi:hypothetical protein